MLKRSDIPAATTDTKLPPPNRNGGIVSLFQCVRSISNPIGLTKTLGLFQLLGYCTGNSAVVSEVLAEDGRHLRLKCYTRPKENLEAVYGDSLRREELYVFTGDGGVWIDVVVDDWIEGRTLSEVIDEAARTADRPRLAALAGRFDDLARRMLARDWAHGDLKPDNIIVTPEGELRLIDFDAVYLPELRRRRTCELGTAAWQHPSRGLEDYDRHLDDYPIALISTLLNALAVDPSILSRYADADGMPLDSQRIAAGRCEALEYIERMFAGRCMAARYRVAQLLRSRAYILPQLAGLLDLGRGSEERCEGACEGVYKGVCDACAGRPELTMRNGLYGCECEGREVIPPLFDDIAVCRDGVAEVVLGGVRHLWKMKK